MVWTGSWFRDRFTYNKDRDLWAFQVDTKHAHSTHSEVITTNETDYAIITADAGETIMVAGAQISVAGNVGEIDIDFEDGTPVKRLYSSNKTQVFSQSVSIHGSTGGNLLFTGDGSSNDIFIVINYKIHSM